ncbi:DUF3465 domain-containing protein [Marinobacterium lacunae]|nr:DUF3465 domain-containing protein [Marinobacterium lacunae]
MKKILILLVIGFVAVGYLKNETTLFHPGTGEVGVSDERLADAWKNGESDLQVEGAGVVIKILADDLSGSRHQRFILELGTGQTLLIAHNIDLAERIDSLREGDRVEFFGEYEWNQKGGVIHWTHHDPAGRHVGGWLRHEGVTYQ